MSPNEPSVDIVRIVKQARSEKHKKLFQIFSRKGAKEIPVASLVRWEEHLRMLKVLERAEKLQEKIFQELKKKRAKEALELMGGTHKLEKLENERHRARMLQGLELSGFSLTVRPLVLAHLPWHKMRMKRSGGFSGTEGGSVDPERKVGQSARIKNHKRRK